MQCFSSTQAVLVRHASTGDSLHTAKEKIGGRERIRREGGMRGGVVLFTGRTTEAAEDRNNIPSRYICTRRPDTSSARDSLRKFLYNDGLIENSISITLCMLDRPPYFSCSTISGLKLRLLILDKNAVVFKPNQEKKKLKRRVMAIRVLNSQLPLL
jgi:hypothetical protein